ncbi:hypothetical protein OS965_32785 [Streptomyces sp. H27-G5]|uniref:hypothetical protein n=1 Tax=Streptomyces sp. H27-G5 TaxID=2996698 RepID=UPI00226EEF6F|nr:hypothetical protein [Streptomyces sp. H27-G5]MCY0922866.1 hypothetical protein [Streptomyces sp. H27-G5]
MSTSKKPPTYTGGDIAKISGAALYLLARRGRGNSMAQAGKYIDRVKADAKEREAYKRKIRAEEEAAKKEARLAARYGKKR